MQAVIEALDAYYKYTFLHLHYSDAKLCVRDTLLQLHM